MSIEEQVALYHSLRAKLRWKESRGYQTGGFDGWMQRGGIAVWVNYTGLNIGVNRAGGYSPLESWSTKGLQRPPRHHMSWEEVVPLWREGFLNLTEQPSTPLGHKMVLSVILAHVGVSTNEITW